MGVTSESLRGRGGWGVGTLDLGRGWGLWAGLESKWAMVGCDLGQTERDYVRPGLQAGASFTVRFHGSLVLRDYETEAETDTRTFRKSKPTPK